MPVPFSCPECGHTAQAKSALVGKRVKCPGCTRPVLIAAPKSTTADAVAVEPPPALRGPAKASVLTKPPAERENTLPPRAFGNAPADRKEVMRQVLTSFDGTCPKVRPSGSYIAVMLFTLPAMLMLVAVYLALVAAVGYLTYWHVMHNPWMLTYGVGMRSRVVMAVLFVAGAILGPSMLLLMLKPLIPGPRSNRRARELKFSKEPVFHSFVERIALAVDAPIPSRIEVINEPNAYAGMRGFFFGLFGRKLVLVVGMPLVAGLNSQQLAGVIAHELGHFSQGFGMRAGAMIRGITGWFGRIAYGQDAWDEWLNDMTDSDIPFVEFFATVAIGGNQLVRGIFFVLLVISHGVSCVVSRQQEYDADRYEYRLVGSKCFQSTSKEMIRLDLADQIAIRSLLSREFLTPEIPRHYCDYLMDVRQVAKADLNKAVAAILERDRGSIFSTHPTTAQRIAAANRETIDPVFTLKIPARQLFSSFDAQAEAVSPKYFKHLRTQFASAYEG